MIRLALCAAFIFFTAFFAKAEEPLAGTSPPNGEEGETEASGAADFFPVFALYGSALAGEVSWRPDWPLSVPPDAFSFPPEGASALTLTRGSGETAEDMTVRRNDDALLSEFPLFRDGVFFQVQTRFGGSGLIRGFTIAPWDILVVEYEDAFPSLIRITYGETVYFAMIEYKAAETVEIWYDEDGNALAVFSYRNEAPGGRLRRFTRTDLLSGEEFTEAYHYDSMGNISGIITSTGEYSALYAGKGKPRYWERFVPLIPEAAPPDAGQPAEPQAALPETPDAALGFEHFHYSFQWDEEGLLVRLTGSRREEGTPGQDSGGGTGYREAEETDIRCEYIRDEQGAWIERRDTPMIRRSGFLVPGPVERFTRRIEYPAP
jgi:hypothetical protein